MSITIHNNTDLTAQDAWSDVKHLLLAIGLEQVKSITIENNKIMVFGEDCMLLEQDTSKPLKTIGTIRWFDKVGGTGAIRLPSRHSVHFYACNVVGANSQYHQLVTNVDFSDGDKVTLELSSDPYTFNNLGATNIKAVK
jgi:hypothetical protein